MEHVENSMTHIPGLDRGVGWDLNMERHVRMRQQKTCMPYRTVWALYGWHYVRVFVVDAVY